MSFADALKTLPEANGARLRLTDAVGTEVAIIENGPGTAGSFRVYAYLADKHAGINPVAAAEGLEIFAEHTDDARIHVGKHPNIDRLIELQASGATLAATVE